MWLVTYVLCGLFLFVIGRQGDHLTSCSFLYLLGVFSVVVVVMRRVRGTFCFYAGPRGGRVSGRFCFVPLMYPPTSIVLFWGVLNGIIWFCLRGGRCVRGDGYDYSRCVMGNCPLLQYDLLCFNCVLWLFVGGAGGRWFCVGLGLERRMGLVGTVGNVPCACFTRRVNVGGGDFCS